MPHAKGKSILNCVHIVQMTNYNIGSGSRRKIKNLQETPRTERVPPGTTQISVESEIFTPCPHRKFKFLVNAKIQVTF